MTLKPNKFLASIYNIWVNLGSNPFVGPEAIEFAVVPWSLLAHLDF